MAFVSRICVWEHLSSSLFFYSLGEQYARMMLLFCMTVMFCVSCPLITPFGCMYFITKHYVDRHNIFYVYKPSKINKRVHATAISFVILSTVVLQFFMTIFRYVFKQVINAEFQIFSTNTKVTEL